ncbi:energy-coupled thiamine transporter ThiT [Bacillota bacterium LX-D]|nr:energy-coupled thiamine transporter ThiT [Bacillota bacterium LX-D]
MRNFSTKMIVEAGVLIALAQILSYVKIYESAYGGSVTAGSMIPILFFAVRWGWQRGIVVGAVYGALQFILGAKYSFSPLSIFLDYIAAFGALGLAGVMKATRPGILVGTVIGVAGRFIAHLISGVVIWASYAPKGMNPWVYSIVYNASYLVPELIISLFLLGLVAKPLIEKYKLGV